MLKKLWGLAWADTSTGFSIRVLVLLGLIMGISVLPGFRAVCEQPMIDLAAATTHGILDLIGIAVTRNGAFLTVGMFTAEVVIGCTGLYVFLILLAAVLAFPASVRAKVVGLGCGAALLFVLNQVRMVTLMLVGDAYPSLFDEAHHYVWQGVTIVVTAVFWYLWAARSAPVPPEGAVSTEGVAADA